MKKKIVALFLVTLCTGVLLTGCGKADDQAEVSAVESEETSEDGAPMDDGELIGYVMDEMDLGGTWNVSGVYLDGLYLDEEGLADYGLTSTDMDAHLFFYGNGGTFISSDMEEEEAFTYYVQLDDFGVYVVLEFEDGTSETLEYNEDGRLVIAYDTVTLEEAGVSPESYMGVAFEKEEGSEVLYMEPDEDFTVEEVETETEADVTEDVDILLAE